MNIVSISALYPPYIMGGAERSAASLAEGLVQRGHEVTVVTLTPADMPVEPKVESGVKVFRLPLYNRYWPYNVPQQTKPKSKWQHLVWHARDMNNQAMVQQVTQVLDEVKPDVVLTHNLQGFSTAVWPAATEKGYPILHTIHDYALICPRTTLFKGDKSCGLGGDRCLECKVLTYPKRAHADAVSAVVGVSQAVLNIHLQHGLFTNIPSQPIINAMNDDAKPQVRVRDQADARVSFGFLGRVDGVKGFSTLLEALAGLPKDKVRVVVGGKVEPEFMAMIAQKYDLSNVVFLGFCKPQDLFKQIDVLVVPSLWQEPLGNVVFEAYFQGLPVIGSDQGGIPEMIEAGKTGFVFEGGNAPQLQGFMRQFLDAPALAQDMLPAIREKANYFLPKRRIDAYEAMLKKIARV